MTDLTTRSRGTPKHGLPTRLFHGALALAVVIQLGTSLGMEMPRGGRPGDLLFGLHEVSGLAALGLATLFWLAALLRRRGTPLGRLFPWFSAARRAALWQDMRQHLLAATRFRLPDHRDEAALPSAVHGLGLILMTAMAATGGTYYAFAVPGQPLDASVRLVLEVHSTLGNLAWAYLLGHAALALLQHLSRNLTLDAMWSLRG